MARTPRSSAGTRTRTRSAPGSRRTPRTNLVTSRAAKEAADHGRSRGFFGSLVHDVTHPGLSEILAATNPVALPFYLAGHAHNRVARTVGHVGQALATSPQMLAVHPKATGKDLGKMAVSSVEAGVGLTEPYIRAVRSQASPLLGGRTRGRSTGISPGLPGVAKTYGSLNERLVQATKTNATVLRKSVVADMKNRYGENWKEAAAKDPLYNFADLLTVLGPAFRGAATARAFSALREADGLEAFGGRDWAQLSKGEKVKAIRSEVAQPGAAIEGKPRGRQITYQPPDGEPIEATLPASRSPLRRSVQTVNDKLSQTFPNAAGVGARSRVTRAHAAQTERAVQRAYGSLPGAESVARLPKEGMLRLWAEGQLVKRPAHLVGEDANLAEHADSLASHNAKVDAELKNLRDTLAKEYKRSPDADASLPQWVLDAKKKGFGGDLVKALDKAIAHKPGADYHRAYGYMKAASSLSRQTILDSHGFSALKNDLTRAHDRVAQYEQLAEEGKLVRPEKLTEAKDDVNRLETSLRDTVEQVDEMMSERQGLMRRFVDVHNFRTPESQAWAQEWASRGASPEQIDAQMAVTNQAAFNHPAGPEAFWQNRVGMPSQEGAVSFLGGGKGKDALFQDFPDFGETPLIEGDVMRPAATSKYYSRAQQTISKAWGKKPRRQAGQVEAQLRKAMSEDEWRNSGLDTFFDQFGKNEMISQEQLQTHLSIPLNQYNLREIHLEGSNAAWPTFGTRFDDKWDFGHSLLARAPSEGQYHEIVFALPDPEELGRPIWNEVFARSGDYEGKGFDHWELPNVTGHMRFQVFEEGGVRKMLVEEIQSDWASDFRKGDVTQRPPLSAQRHNELAVDRLLRYAGENQIDQVIFPEGKVQQARSMQGSFIERQHAFDHWDQMDDLPPEQARQFIEETMQGERSAFPRIYEETLPSIVTDKLGLKGEMTENAWHGHFASEGGSQSQPGAMRGTVFHLDDAARAKAVKPSHLYQRQPNWAALPKGATEFLADNKTRIRMFEGADLSTWMHELFHVSMSDLPEEHLAVLDNYYGNGKGVSLWDEATHENAARDFERYLRSGKSPNRLLAAAFESIGQWMRDLFNKAKEEGKPLPKDVEEAFGAIFREHASGADVPDFFIPHRARGADLTGISGSKGVARANRDIGDYVPSREQIFARNNLLLLRSGLINPDPRLLIDHVNRLVQLQRANGIREFLLEHATPVFEGETVDPATHYAIKKAGTSLDKPLYDALEAANNPDHLRQSIQAHVNDNITDDQRLIDAWKEQESKGLAQGKARQLYKIDKQMADDLFKNLTGKTPGATTKPGATGTKVVDALLDSWRGLLLYGNPGFYTANGLGNSFMLAMSDPRAFRDIGWSVKNASKAAFNHGQVDHLWNRVATEMGRGPTTGSFSRRERYLGGPLDEGMVSGGPIRRRARIVRAQARHISSPKRGESRTRLVAEGTSHAWGNYGHHAGALIDDTFRVPAWMQSARKHGVKGKKEMEKLLDDATSSNKEVRVAAQKKLHAIRDEAEQLMLDFDSMTPFEKTWLSRIVFLYPFVRASVKYPFMYAGERPFVAGLQGIATSLGEEVANQTLGPRDEGLPVWTDQYARFFGGKYLPLGSFSPWQSFGDTLQTAAGLGRPTQVGVNDPFGLIPPLAQVAIDLSRNQNQYGRDLPWWKILQQDAAFPSWMTQATGLRQPSPVYTDRNLLQTFLRSTRVVPFGMKAQAGG